MTYVEPHDLIPTAIYEKVYIYRRVQNIALELRVIRPTQRGVAPGIVFFFGGGWENGDVTQFLPHASRLASRGLVAAVAEYRVRSRHGVSPFACFEDACAALSWLRAHAAELGLDPQRLAACGGSAGGHLAACAAMVGVAGSNDGVSHQTEHRPDALVLFNPVLDTSERGFGHARFGGRALELSPLHLIVPGLPPTIIFHGAEDRAVPLACAKQFRDASVRAGNCCELVVFESEGHGFFNLFQSEAHFEQTLALTDAFLVSLGYLNPEKPVEPVKGDTL